MAGPKLIVITEFDYNWGLYFMLTIIRPIYKSINESVHFDVRIA